MSASYMTSGSPSPVRYSSSPREACDAKDPPAERTFATHLLLHIAILDDPHCAKSTRRGVSTYPALCPALRCRRERRRPAGVRADAAPAPPWAPLDTLERGALVR